MVTKKKKKKGHPLFRCIFGSKLLHRSQNNAILGGVLQKKKKGHRLYCYTFTITFGLNMSPNVAPTKWGPVFFFFGDVIAVTNFSDNTRTLSQIAQNLFNLQCATSNHAMRQIWRNAPRLATPAVAIVLTQNTKVVTGSTSKHVIIGT